MVLLVLVGGVYKLPKLENVGPGFCPWGHRMTAPHGTSNGGTGTSNGSAIGPWRVWWCCHSGSLGTANGAQIREERCSKASPHITPLLLDWLSVKSIWNLAMTVSPELNSQIKTKTGNLKISQGDIITPSCSTGYQTKGSGKEVQLLIQRCLPFFPTWKDGSPTLQPGLK